MRIAIEGCCHGELDKIYASLLAIERKESIKIDLLIICGDFQSIRNLGDLDMMACPEKHRTLGNFYEYYSGAKTAPILTVFVGGNHEASNYLWELYHGGWVCPNIYFLGFAGVLNYRGIRIAGLTGIYNSQHYDLGFYETQPFNNQDCRSVYHVRKYNVFRLAQIRTPIDVFISHDWPRGIAKHGNFKKLLMHKKHLADEVHKNTLGSYPGEFLLNRLKPDYWFAAHLHVKFAALVEHPLEQPVSVDNPDEIAISDELDPDDHPEGSDQANGSGTNGAPAKPPKKYTRFLSLDKCLPNREFLQVIDVPASDSEPAQLRYDAEWLAIVRATFHLMSFSRDQIPLPSDDEIRAKIDVEKEWVASNIKPDGLAVPSNFEMSTAPHLPNHSIRDKSDLGIAAFWFNSDGAYFLHP
ncbi:lariat debranching enzyme, C-terminal domain-containing protein [Zopfochytrium polystomum]|nr:lariat debranching enzyme, C-terminal domain-containing protein [Zopfochytrium polystomum]